MGTKKEQRSLCKGARTALTTEERAKASQTICELIKQHQISQDAKNVLAYATWGVEVDITELNEWFERSGVKVAYPICGEEGKMIAAVPLKGEGFEIGKYGIRAPIMEKSELIPPDAIDLVLVPCVGFDEEKMRLGMGKGYYDRYLPQCTHAVKLLVAYEAQKVDRIIRESFDHPVDWIVTEKGIR